MGLPEPLVSLPPTLCVSVAPTKNWNPLLQVTVTGISAAAPFATRVPLPTMMWWLQMLGSLRRAAWFVVSLLALVFIVTLLKR